MSAIVVLLPFSSLPLDVILEGGTIGRQQFVDQAADRVEIHKSRSVVCRDWYRDTPMNGILLERRQAINIALNLVLYAPKQGP